MLDLILAAALLQPPAPQWRSVHRSEVGEVFVDPASLRRDGDAFEIDVRGVFGRAQSNGMTSGIARNRYNCARQSMAALHIRFFDANGRTLQDGPVSGPSALDRPVGGNSANAAILRTFCPRRTPG